MSGLNKDQENDLKEIYETSREYLKDNPELKRLLELNNKQYFRLQVAFENLLRYYYHSKHENLTEEEKDTLVKDIFKVAKNIKAAELPELSNPPDTNLDLKNYDRYLRTLVNKYTTDLKIVNDDANKTAQKADIMALAAAAPAPARASAVKAPAIAAPALPATVSVLPALNLEDIPQRLDKSKGKLSQLYETNIKSAEGIIEQISKLAQELKLKQEKKLTVEEAKKLPQNDSAIAKLESDIAALAQNKARQGEKIKELNKTIDRINDEIKQKEIAIEQITTLFNEIITLISNGTTVVSSLNAKVDSLSDIFKVTREAARGTVRPGRKL